MLNKYDFTNNDDVIDQPSILKITGDQVQIIHAGGTSPDTKEIPEEGLVIQIGNIDSFIPPTPDPIDPDDPEPTPTPIPEDGITMTAMIVNSAGGRLNIRQLQLLLWDEDNQKIQSVTGTVTTNNRIEQSSSAQCTVIFEKEYEGLHFASGEQYSETSYLCNCGYKINGSDYTFTTSGVSESYIFQDGGSFTVTIPNNTTEWTGGGQIPTYDTDPDPQPEPGDSVSQGIINLIIKNDSNITFDEDHQISTTQDGQTVTATTKLNAYFKLYVQGAQNKISIIMSARNNSSQTDLNLDSNNNPACRFLDSGYTLIPNGQTQISNVHWKVNSDDTRDNIPETGRDIINGTGEGSNTFYMSNGYYSTKDFGIKVVVSGESGKFKNNGTYTLSIQNV